MINRQSYSNPALSFMSEMPDEFIQEREDTDKALTKARYGGSKEALYIPRDEQWWRPPLQNLDHIVYPKSLGSTVVPGTVWSPRPSSALRHSRAPEKPSLPCTTLTLTLTFHFQCATSNVHSPFKNRYHTAQHAINPAQHAINPKKPSEPALPSNRSL